MSSSVVKGFEGVFSNTDKRFGRVRKQPSKRPLVLGKKGKLDSAEMEALRARLETVTSWGHAAPNHKKRAQGTAVPSKNKARVVVPQLGRDVRGGAGPIYHQPMKRRAGQILADLEVAKARENAQPMLSRPTYAKAAKEALQEGYRSDLREFALCSNSLVRRDTRSGHEVGQAAAEGGAGRRLFEGSGETSSHVQSALFDPYRAPAVTDDATRVHLKAMSAVRAHCTPFALADAAYKGEAV